MEKIYDLRVKSYPFLKKLIMEIKIAFIIIVVSISNVLATDSYSQTAKVTLKMENQTLEQVLDEIEKQSEFYFIFNQKQIDVSRIVDVQVENKLITDILPEIFNGTNIYFTILDRNILLTNEVLRTEFHSDPLPFEIQQQTISGTVVDASTREPMPGVNIIVKGTTIGQITDAQGKYSLSVSDLNATLVITFIGYNPQEVPISGRRVVDVAMVPTIEALSEVVVVGYGTVRRADLTGSVGSVDRSVLQEQPVVNVLNAMEGRVAGVQIMNAVGDEPGGGSNIRIRGVGSISAGGEPLVVVDGLPGASMSAINPNDIETIDILKDASATAIYGSRGANGVILITTKRGKEGKAVVSFDTYLSFSKIAKRPEFMSVMDQAWYYYYGVRNQNADLGRDVSGPPRSWFYAVPETVMNVIEGTNTLNYNMLDQILQVAPTQSYTLSASGGTADFKYNISGEYLNQEGVVILTPFKRYSLRTNFDARLTERLDVQLNSSVIYSERFGADAVAGGRGDGVIGMATTWMPWYPGYNEDGSYFVCFGIDAGNNRTNPLATLKETKRKIEGLRFLGNLNTTYRITKDLNLRIMLGTTRSDSHTMFFRPQLPVFNEVASGSDSRSSSLDWITETTLNYKKSFNKHNLTGLLGYTTQKAHDWSNSIGSSSYTNNLVPTLNAVGNIVQSATSSESEWSLLSYLARINYDYSSRYFITASIRADGSSRFGRSNKYGVFPSVALAWRISDESFLRDVSAINDMKLRVSYGETGNHNIGNYDHIPTISYSSAVLGNGKAVGYAPSRLANDFLTWEKQRSLNTGVDARILRDRIYFNLDYFYTRNYDLLLNVSIPLVTGFGSTLQNIGEIENKGWEFTLSTKNFVGDFEWTTEFNISSFKNKVLKLGPEGAPLISARHITQIGSPIGMFYGYKTDGIFLSQAELDAGPIYSPGAQDRSRVGDIRFTDVSGPDGVPDGIINTYDRTIIGNPYPDFYYGMTNRFRYKNIRVAINLKGSYGNEIISGTDYYLYTRARYRQYISEVNYFISEDNPGDGKTVRPNNNPSGGNRQVSDRLIDPGSFLKVTYINMSYDFPRQIAQRLHLGSLRAYFNINNPILITKFRAFNPEISSSSNSLNPGVDNDDYPITKGVTMGINVTF